MKRFRLPDGSYVNPGAIRKFEVVDHFLGRKYYVQMSLYKEAPIDVRNRLTLAEAQNLKQQCEQQLEALHADTSAYEDGYESGEAAGRENGYQIGFEDGRRAGYAAGVAELEQQAHRAGMQAVLDQLGSRHDQLLDEMRYQAHLVEPRRQALIAMIELIEDIMAGFRPPEPEAQMYNPDKDPR